MLRFGFQFVLTRKIAQTVMKLCFSAVFIQLFYISLIIGGAGEKALMLSEVPGLLECAALTASVTLCGGYLMERTIRESESR